MSIRSTIKSVMKKRRESKIRANHRRAERALRRRVKKYVIHAAAIDDLLNQEPSRNFRVL